MAKPLRSPVFARASETLGSPAMPTLCQKNSMACGAVFAILPTQLGPIGELP